jgi:predicted lipoprotein with Yx(FWY)xxD motif
MRRLLALSAVAVIAAVVLVVAASGGGSSSPAAAPSPYKAARSTAGGTTVRLARTSLGSILVDAHGRSLYLFEADTPRMSDCSGSCASVWPPLTATAAPHAGAGVATGKLGTIARAGGGRQITYNGHPLYTFAGDTKAGATTGQGLDQFGAEWYVLNAAGHKIDGD